MSCHLRLSMLYRHRHIHTLIHIHPTTPYHTNLDKSLYLFIVFNWAIHFSMLLFFPSLSPSLLSCDLHATNLLRRPSFSSSFVDPCIYLLRFPLLSRFSGLVYCRLFLRPQIYQINGKKRELRCQVKAKIWTHLISKLQLVQ